MRSGAKLIHKSSNNSGALPRIENYVGLRIESIVRARTKAAVTVTVTSLVKKCVDPAQDIRRHRVEIPGGYSGHELDSKIVTPFLKANGFPAVSESGWVRRLLKQNAPYGLSYAGSIGGNGLKEAFLRVLDAVEGGKADPHSLLTYMLKQLVGLRELERVRLARPTGLTISGIAQHLDSHFSGVGSGKARLPILAVYAAYRQMVGSGTGRYRHMNLREMESLTVAGSRLGSIRFYDHPLRIGKFRSDTIVPHTKCQTRLIRSYANCNRKTKI